MLDPWVRVLTRVIGGVDCFGCVRVPSRLKDKVLCVLQCVLMHYTGCYFTGTFHAVIRQISMLFIDSRASDSWSKGPGFESRQERREKFLLQGQLSVLTLISVSRFRWCVVRTLFNLWYFSTLVLASYSQCLSHSLLHCRVVCTYSQARVTAVARKRSRSFCHKGGWQVTAKHTYTLPM